MKKIVLISLMISMIGVSCSSQGKITENDKAQIQEVIANHDKTLIYIWADYCQASKNMFEANIKPHLEGLANNNAGIVIIYYGKEENVAYLKKEGILLIAKDCHYPLLVKRDANKAMKSLLKGYKKYNGMPIPILVDREGNILNFDTESSIPYRYWEIIQAAEKK